VAYGSHGGGLQSEASIGLVYPEETTLQTVLIHKDCVVVEVLTAYTIFADELLEYPPNDEVMKLGQAKDRGYSGEAVGLTSKEHQHVNLVHKLRYRFLVVHIVRYRFLPHMVPHILLFLLNPDICKTFHSNRLLVMKNLHPYLLVILKTQKNLHPRIRKIHQIFHPHLLLVLKNKKNLHLHIHKRQQICHPHHHTHHLLLHLLLMKQQNLHPKWKCSKQSFKSRYIWA
jgi:hypothetical protein